MPADSRELLSLIKLFHCLITFQNQALLKLNLEITKVFCNNTWQWSINKIWKFIDKLIITLSENPSSKSGLHLLWEYLRWNATFEIFYHTSHKKHKSYIWGWKLKIENHLKKGFEKWWPLVDQFIWLGPLVIVKFSIFSGRLWLVILPVSEEGGYRLLNIVQVL